MDRNMVQVSEEKWEQLKAARTSLAERGSSPRKISLESRMTIINWNYLWGYTSSSIIQDRLGRTSGGYGNKLAAQGWLTATKTESGIPRVFYTLTEMGLQEAERYAPELYRYPESDPYRVNQKLLRHNLLAQKITIDAIRSGLISGFETERMLAKKGDKSGVKRPDVVLITTNKLRIGIEVELSAKWARDLDDFVLGIVRALDSTTHESNFSRFTIASDSPAIIDRYKKAMAPGARLNTWVKNQRNHWVVDKTIMVPDWLILKIDFQLIG